ncbi:hypothetical protein conserved [Leishmania donovani]|uniref:Hypothetical_protein_conserved n=1 Tax=Leishmania donovani TaxID=5661 RepID=A0A504XAT5_LEIDO|nr:hypothetical protein CGC20_23710 [Leishmania donovani]CAJ1987034.1 hypothetical protein conserved [Leishmania donovani]VDZ42923.1 hypothetical_protein_conserved [Leishmania donovani]
MTQPPGASEKEKTARLVASLSRHEQVELLAQALLREYMHRRGLRETLRTFDAENPRDERTISSRALMRQLLNIPVDGRPSRLQPTASSSSAKPQAPTFMEELCSYRLTKNSYRSLDGKRGGEQQRIQEEDPSDVELRALREAADAQRAAKTSCEQKQREYEELLAAEEAYQQRKEGHKERRKRKYKDKRRRSLKQRFRDDAGSNDDEAESESEQSDDSEGKEGAALVAGYSHASRRPQWAPSGKRRLSAESGSGVNATAVAVGAHWQPPGNAARAGADHSTSGDGVSRRSAKIVSGGTVRLGLDNADIKDRSDHDSEADPFGLSGASRQALMARVRAESEHWPTQANGGATHAHASSTSNVNGDGGAPDSTLSAAPAALSTLAGRGAGDRGLASLSGPRPVGRAAAGFNPNGTYASPSFSGSLSATVPAGANGGMAALRMKASSIPIPGLSADGAVRGLASTHSSGFPSAMPTVSSAPSILVKHVSARQQCDDGAASDGALHSYDRTALPRSSALAGSNGGSTARTAAACIPSPNASALSESASPVFSVASRSPASNAGGSGGGGGSGLRHGIGFRTSSTSAEGTASSSAAFIGAADPAAGAAKPSRKERRVKLLVD